MALKSQYNPDDQIYEHIVQSSDSSILPEELSSMYILPVCTHHQWGKACAGGEQPSVHSPASIQQRPAFWKSDSNSDQAHEFHAVNTSVCFNFYFI